jgi:hypothetical protein
MEWSKVSKHSLWAFLSVPLLGILCAYVNVGARQGSLGLVWLFITSLIVCVPWAIITRYSKMSLSIAGAVFDGLYAVAHLITFVYLGQGATPLQLTGAGITILGMVLMAL